MTRELQERQEVGEVMHLAKSSRLIVRLLGSSGKETRPGEILVDQKGKGVGKVLEVIGPVAAPYASVIPLTDRTNKVLGIKVYRGRSLTDRTDKALGIKVYRGRSLRSKRQR